MDFDVKRNYKYLQLCLKEEDATVPMKQNFSKEEVTEKKTAWEKHRERALSRHSECDSFSLPYLVFSLAHVSESHSSNTSESTATPSPSDVTPLMSVSAVEPQKTSPMFDLTRLERNAIFPIKKVS